MPAADVHRTVWTALMAALVAVGGHVHIPLGPVPVSLQTLFLCLAGFVLGPSGGAWAVGAYLAAGAVGLPVFAGGASGLAYLLGPTGGYLAGFAALAALCGMASAGPGREPSWPRLIGWGLAGTAALYGLGMARLMAVLDLDLAKAVALGVLPFLPGDLVKLVLAAVAYRHLFKRRLLPW